MRQPKVPRGSACLLSVRYMLVCILGYRRCICMDFFLAGELSALDAPF